MMIICNEIGRQQGRDDVFYLVLRNTAQMNENDSGPAIGKNILPSFGLGNEEREKSIGDVYIVGGAPFCVVFEAGICVFQIGEFGRHRLGNSADAEWGRDHVFSFEDERK